MNIKHTIASVLYFISTLSLSASQPSGYPCDPPPSKYEVIVAPIDIDTAKFQKLLQRLSDGLDYIPGKPIQFKPGEGVKIKVEVRQKEFCCDGVVKQFQKYKGSATINIGSVSGSGPVPYLYYPGIGGFTFNLSGDIGLAFSVNSEYPDCAGEREVCGSVNIEGKASGGVTGLVVDPEILSISGTMELSAKGGATYCLNEGLKDPKASYCFRAGKVVARTFWHTFTITEGYPIAGDCS